MKKEVFGEIARRAARRDPRQQHLDARHRRARRGNGAAESVIGLHFFSPAHVMRLVEIVRGVAHAATVLATALQLAKRLAKVGVVVATRRASSATA